MRAGRLWQVEPPSASVLASSFDRQTLTLPVDGRTGVPKSQVADRLRPAPMTPMTNLRARAARGLVAAAVLALVGMACTGGTTDSTPFPSPSGHPTAFDAEKVHTTTPIKHVVFI